MSPPHDSGDVVHEPASLAISFVTRPLGTSLAIWDVPSPVVIGTRFSLKVGAKSEGSSVLTGATVEVLDEAGALVGRGQLGEVPWVGTGALYWTDVELTAPLIEGMRSWSVRLLAIESGLPHAESMASFSAPSVKPPDCRLKITFTDKDTDMPIKGADVRLGPFHAITDALGRAELAIPGGCYDVNVWHCDYEVLPVNVQIDDDVTLQLRGIPVPEEDPSARWMM